MHTKDKGDLAESVVITEALRRGYTPSIPFGENNKYDLVVDRRGALERVQVKYTESDGEVVVVHCRSTNNWQDIRYTVRDVDWIVTYDRTTDRCYFVPGALLGEGRATVSLRLTAPSNGQVKRILWAKDFADW